MKAVSLWEPWATLVRLKIKRIETRGWSTSYRGPLAIHATKHVHTEPVGDWLAYRDVGGIWRLQHYASGLADRVLLWKEAEG